MGLIKQFAMDREELGLKAANAAWIDNPTERFDALTAAFEACGERAVSYHDPAHAVRELVNAVITDYRLERRVIHYERIAEGV
ncbi:hypothetical protein ACWDBD_38795 [Streptomyces sp. NPDC001118]|uniref:hypothetical protein n=1 Tax=Streptomyces sp. NPDC001127 TaxID=3154377 RepID=UPI0033166DCD